MQACVETSWVVSGPSTKKAHKGQVPPSTSCKKKLGMWLTQTHDQRWLQAKSVTLPLKSSQGWEVFPPLGQKHSGRREVDEKKVPDYTCKTCNVVFPQTSTVIKKKILRLGNVPLPFGSKRTAFRADFRSTTSVDVSTVKRELKRTKSWFARGRFRCGMRCVQTLEQCARYTTSRRGKPNRHVLRQRPCIPKQRGETNVKKMCTGARTFVVAILHDGCVHVPY